jgi:chromosome segregation ATPase
MAFHFRLDGLLAEATRQLETWAQEVESARAEAVRQQNRIDDLEAQTTSLGKQLLTVTADAMTQQSQLQQLRSEHQAALDAGRQLGMDKAALELALQQSTAEAKAAVIESQASTEAFERLREQLAVYRSKLETFQVSRVNSLATCAVSTIMCAVFVRLWR